MHKYYVYAHREADTGRVFYVGKGSGNRAHETGNRSEFWKRVYRKHGRIVEMIAEGLSEPDAYRAETEAIARFRAIGECRVNVSNGGDGVRVTVRWWGAAISKAQKGMKRPRGKDSASFKDFATEEQICADYETMSTTAIAKKYGVTATTVWERLLSYGVTPRKPGFRPVAVQCVEDGAIFPSIKAAALHYGLYGTNINKVIRGRHKSAGGKTFRYAETKTTE